MKKVIIINGPNLNMLGKRDPKVYGDITLNNVEEACKFNGVAPDTTYKWYYRNK